MTAWAITLVPCAVLAALTILAVQGMSKRAKLAADVIIAAAIVLEVAAVIAYRHSTDGQTGILWFAIPVYALLALAGLRLLDKALRRTSNGRLRT